MRIRLNIINVKMKFFFYHLVFFQLEKKRPEMIT